MRDKQQIIATARDTHDLIQKQRANHIYLYISFACLPGAPQFQLLTHDSTSADEICFYQLVRH